MGDQAGFGLVEVLVSAVVILLVTTATVSSIGASQKQSTRTLARGINANLAEQDQERMRAMRATDLVGYTATRSVVQENATYTVTSKAEFVQSANGDEINCSSTGAQTRNLRITSTVTPQASLDADPLTVRSLVPLPVAQFSANSGTLVVRVYKADKTTGQPGIAVSVSGPESRTATTNADGCAIFQFLRPGSYTGTLNQSGFVDPALSQLVSFTGTVTAATINQASALFYDRAGSIAVTYDGGNSTNSRGVSIAHASLSAPTTRTSANNPLTFVRPSPPNPANSYSSAVFPFPTPYSVYAGDCEANNPLAYEPNFYADHPGYNLALVPATSPATQQTANLHEPAINMRITVTKYSSAVVGSPVALVALFDSGCDLPVTTTTWNQSTGALTSPRYPYGQYYYVCAQITQTSGSGTNGTYSAVGGPYANTDFAGTARQNLVIDATNTNTSTSRRTCASRS